MSTTTTGLFYTRTTSSTPVRATLLHARGPRRVAANLYGLRTAMVNAFFYGDPADPSEWMLIDGGMPGFSGAVISAAERLFGKNNPPSGIILTHGHFDHIGAVGPILRRWPDVPIFAHPLELPFLNGEQDYLPPDPSVGQGVFSLLSPLFPRHSRNYGATLYPLPADGSVPGMPEWQWVHTPGHTPGHISLFRERDRTIIAGDAFTTVRQESFWAVLRQRVEFRPPPAYFTTDWAASCMSIERLADLSPFNAVTGHGRVLAGPVVAPELQRLVDDFGERGVPKNGRYVRQTWRTDAIARSRETVGIHR